MIVLVDVALPFTILPPFALWYGRAVRIFSVQFSLSTWPVCVAASLDMDAATDDVYGSGLRFYRGWSPYLARCVVLSRSGGSPAP